MGLLIQHGTVVTAEKSFPADILIERETVKEVRPGIPAASHNTLDASGMYLLPGGIDAHTHLDMPFGGTTSSDDFETGTRAAAFGGTTTLVDFAIQARGTRMRDALDAWWKKAEGRACIDYGLHMIVTDLGTSGLEDMDDMVREGIASFKLFMAYPNVLMVDDATIFKALKQTAKNRARLSRPHASHRSRSRSRQPRHRHGGNCRRARLHRPSLFRRRPQSGPRSAQPRRSRLRGNLPAISSSHHRRAEASQLRRRQIRLHPAAPRKRKSPQTLGRPQIRQSPGRLHRSLPLLLRGPENPRQKRLHQNSQWRSGHRKSPPASLPSRRERRQALAQSLRRNHLHRSCSHFRHVSKEGHHRPRQRRRHRRLGSQSRAPHQRQNASHARGLLHV